MFIDFQGLRQKLINKVQGGMSMYKIALECRINYQTLTHIYNDNNFCNPRLNTLITLDKYLMSEDELHIPM